MALDDQLSEEAGDSEPTAVRTREDEESSVSSLNQTVEMHVAIMRQPQI
jgi:hypothetical protein